MKKNAGSLLTAPTLVFIVSLALAVPVLAQSGDSTSPKPVVLTDGQGEYPLGRYLEILEDPGGKLTIEEVSSPAYDAQFIPSQSEVPNYGFTNNTYWVRFHIKNNAGKTERWLLEINFANMQYVDLFLPERQGGGWTVKESGMLRPFSTRDAAAHHIVLAIPLAPRQEGTYYVRFRSEASMSLPLLLWQPEAFFQNLAFELLLLGLFYGALLIMLVYHLFVLYSLREASYLYFVCFLGSIILWLLSYDGLAGQYLWPNRAMINSTIVPYLAVTTIALLLMFVDAFLELKKRQPRMHRLILILAAGLGIGLVLIPFTGYHFTTTWFVPYATVSLITTIAAGLISWRSGYRPARFFLFAWLGLLAGILFTFLIREGYAPSTRVSENLYRLGILWLAAFWSISLTDRVNMLKAEMESANRALQNSEHQLSQILEGLPLAVVVYGKDRKPNYGNRRTYDILSNSARNIRPDISAGRSLEMAIDYYSLKQEGNHQSYPLEKFPVQSALNGAPAYADDIEADLGERRIPLEIWASPLRDNAGNVASAIVAFQDISQRKQAEAELAGYRQQLEALVTERTTGLNAANAKLELRLEWLSAVNTVHDSITGTTSLPGVYVNLADEILRLLGAQMVFIHRWDSSDEQFDAFSRVSELTGPHNQEFVQALFADDTRLRQELEQGKLLTYTLEQAATWNTLFGELTPKHDMPAFVFAPLKIGQSVIGVLGITAYRSSQNLILEEIDLIERMALDLASLTQGAIQLDQAVVLATVEERNRLARELHDSVTQTLFTASVLAEATPHILEKDQRLGSQNLFKLSRLIRGALAEMRSMLIELRMGDLHRQTLEQLLVTLVDGARARSQAAITLSLMKEIPQLPEKVTIVFYRIAREALINATVHSGAAQILVSLLEEPGKLVLCIRDDGCGFDRQMVPAGHLGLSIMAERAQEIGAALQIDTEPGQGTTVKLAWPEQVGEGNNND